MRKTSSILLAAALILGIAAFASVPAQAIGWCQYCDANPTACFACCRCDGYTTAQCLELCPSHLAPEATWMSQDEGEIFACTADEPSTDEPSADDAASADEPSTVTAVAS